MPKNPLNYREEILNQFFDYIKSGESFFLIGIPSTGKTRLIDFVMGDDPDTLRIGGEFDRDQVKKKYLNGAATKVWLVRVDMNRIRYENGWGFHFFELLLNSLLLTCYRHNRLNEFESLKNDLEKYESEIIKSKDDLMAHRLLEMAINQICQIYRIQICFLFDEFDETYQKMSLETFAQLRAIRDTNKYLLSYILFLRNLPEKLRDPLETECFYELISRNMLGLGPFSLIDTLHVIEQLEIRRGYVLSLEERDWLCSASGGHPGLIQSLFNIIKNKKLLEKDILDLEWCSQLDPVHEEFRKIMTGLTKEEQVALRYIASGDQQAINPFIEKQLLAKGLIKSLSDHGAFFTPMFGYWLKRYQPDKRSE